VINIPEKEAEKPEQTENLGEEIGEVTHWFSNISVGVIKINSGALKVGDKIKIKGHTSDFEQPIESMEIDRNPVEEAKAGQSIGLKVKEHVREGDKVYKA